MSTQSTLVHGKNFKLHEDILDGTPHVWLTLLPFAYFYRQARLPLEKHLAIVLTQLRRERAAQRRLQHQITRLSKAHRMPT